MYRELKQLLVKNPHKATHESVLSLIDRYHEALPDTKEMITPKLYLSRRKEALRQLENQPHYTKQTLLEIAATILDENDGREVDDYINNKQTHISMKEYAQESVQKKYLRNIKLTSKSAEDSAIPLPLNNRKRQHMHQFAITGQRIPSELLVKKNKPNSRGGGRGGHKSSGQHRNNHNGKGSNKENHHKSSRGGRGGRGGSRGGNRGGRAPASASSNAKSTNNQNDEESKTCEFDIFDTYDMSKIPQKVAHFGQVTPDMHDLLQAQLIQRNIEIKPKN